MRANPSMINAALGAALFLTGCASIGAHSEGPRPDPYAGVRADADSIAHLAKHPSQSWAIIDLPFSFVWDTLVLPCDVIARILESRYEAKKEK